MYVLYMYSNSNTAPLLPPNPEDDRIHPKRSLSWHKGQRRVGLPQEAKYVQSWPNMTSAWAGWSRFGIPVDRSDGVHSLLICTSITLGSPTCH